MTDILIPEVGPLVRLSQAGVLPLLHEIGNAAVIVDLVRHQLTGDATRPEAEPILQWIAHGLEPGTRAPVRIDNTELGEAVRLARLVKPDFGLTNGGAVAALQWLDWKIAGVAGPVLVLSDQDPVHRLIAGGDAGADAEVLTTRAVLDLAGRRGLIVNKGAT